MADNRTDRQRRTDEAMGEAMYALAQRAKERGEDIDTGTPFASIMDAAKKRDDELGSLSNDEQALMKELCSFFDHDREKGDKKKEVVRAKEIMDELQMNVDFSPFPYGETLLSNAVDHSLDMVKMLIEKGADVNLENEMLSECPIDQLLEEDEMNGGLSDEKKAMKELLLSKGAKTAEERLNEVAESVRRG